MLTFIMSALIGAAVGLLAGALGIGGGILAIPVLVYLLGQEPHAATAESLVIVIVTSAAALPSRFKNHQVRLGTGIVFGLCSSIGAFLGTWFNSIISGDGMMIAFALLLFAVSIFMGRNAITQRKSEDIAMKSGGEAAALTADGDPEEEYDLSWKRLPVFLLIGTFTGIMVGFFGIGGGFVMVPILVLLMHYSMRVAAGTSFIVISVVSIISLLLRVFQPSAEPFQIDWLVAILFAVGSGLGSAIGSPLSNKARSSTLTFIFCVLLIGVAIYTLVETLAF